MMVSLAISPRAILGAFLISIAFVSTAYTKDIDRAALQVAAESGDLEAQRKLGEALLFGVGGVEQEKDSGLRLLEQSAASGNVAAKATLGKVLLEGYYLPADHEKGAQLLQEAADAGNLQAQVTLGMALLWGSYGEADPARAHSLLDQAAGKGNIKALRVLGEQLIGGWVFEQDVISGRTMLEKAAATGDTEAKIVLGTFFMEGTRLNRDTDHALMLFEEAAQSGNGEGLERYGEILMWSQRDPVAAENYLRRAGELGRGTAWVTLAEGAMYAYLGGKSRAKFDGFSEKARDAGEGRIAVLEAERQMWGISMRASGPKTIAGLEEAAKAGNKDAVKFLISLVRNGNRLNIRKNTEQAKTYLDHFSALLTPAEVEQFLFTFDAVKARSTAAYKALAEDLENRPELKSLWFGKELFAANPNFAVYLLQVDMKGKGIYTGPLDGMATRSTLRAIYSECQTIRDASRCGDAVLHPDVIGALLAR
ncbi:MAG: sel1 repeat family protein [Marinosulfonomonas sp.]|nr:sel1 repeat family protein [Marinosulfonomonas sp.]